MPNFNDEFSKPVPENGSVFVPWAGEDIKDVLCEQHKRTVNNDNCVSFKGLQLQIPSDKYRCHYAKVKVKINLYDDGQMAIFNGPRKLTVYNAKGDLLNTHDIKPPMVWLPGFALNISLQIGRMMPIT